MPPRAGEPAPPVGLSGWTGAPSVSDAADAVTARTLTDATSGSAQHRLALETLLADLSSRFARLEEEEIDGEIEYWLRRLTDALGVTRACFSELTEDSGLLVTHTYASPGYAPYPKGLIGTQLPWLVGELMARRTVVLSRIPEDLPPEASAEAEFFRATERRSGIAIPISIGRTLVCVLTFSSAVAPYDWPVELVARLHLAGDVFGNAILRRQNKRNLQRKQNELAHVARVAAMGELASVIAHELDQPLTAIVSNAQAVRYLLEADEPDTGEIDEALADVIDSAMRVSEIVRRERRLLRKSESSFAVVSLNTLVREIELFIRAEARQDGAKVSLQLVPSLPTVFADGVQLQQVILNLAHNAMQAMREQPRETRSLRIVTRSRAGQVELLVTDTGPGVGGDDATLQRMFEPFYTTKPNGLGMGLSIGKSIVEGHHGRIWASRNASGEGLTVHVALPRTKA